MKRVLGAIVLATAVLAGCGGSHHPATTTTTTTPTVNVLPFADPRSAPLEYEDRGVVLRHGGIEVHDVGYASGGHSIDAYLVEGAGTKKRPGIVVVHGSGGDRNELLGDAFALAKRGMVAMTITAPSTAYPPPNPTSNKQLITESRAVQVADVVAVRRAADVLAGLPKVDPARIGYLGWSAGAKTGTFVAASDPRFKALVLLSGGADTLAAFEKSAPVGLRALVRKDLGSVDPLRYIAAARPGTIYLGDGRRDEVVPHAALMNMIAAAPSGTVVRWYPTGHSLNAAAYNQAFAWLAGKLGA